MSRRYLSILILLIFLINLAPSVNIYAKTINIDGDPSDWTGTLPTDSNTFAYSDGEWIWRDASGDERTDFANPDPQVDLLEFRVSGDQDYLYLLFKFNFPSNLYIGDDGATFIALAIDRDRESGSGVEWFAGYSDTKTHSNARWEYQVVINLADSNFRDQNQRSTSSELVANWGGIFYIVNTGWQHITDTYSLLSVNLDNNAIEAKISWNTIGGRPDNTYIRFTLITARGQSNYDQNSGGTKDIGDWQTSNALDAITDAQHTWYEVQDQVVDYYVDVYFTNGEPATPPPPPPPEYKVYGFVKNQFGDPVEGARVTIGDVYDDTDASGYFEIMVARGTYTLTVSKANHEPYSTIVNIEGDTNLGTIVIHRFIVDLTTSSNDFPADAKAYEAQTLLSATGNSENALKYLYVEIDEKFIYFGVDFAPGTWGLALGIGIDANPGTTSGYGAGDSDSWGRKIGFENAYIDYQVYFWVSDGSVGTGQLNKYTGDQQQPWQYNIAPIYYSPLASGHDGTTLFKVAVPKSVIENTPDYNGEILVAVWITGGGGSAVSALPLNPLTLTQGGGEWGDTDTIYTYVKINVPSKSFSPHPTGLTTTITTDKDTYEVYKGYPVVIAATLSDAKSPLMHQTLYIAENPGVTGVTGADGKTTLTITGLDAGTYTFTVKYDGHWSWSGSTKTITVIVSEPPATYRVYGFVTAMTGGTPIAGATVELLDTNFNVIKSTSSGTDGYYEFTDVVPGTYFIRASKSGYAKWLKLVEVAADTEVNIVMVTPRVDITRPVNDFPAGSLVYKANKPLSNQEGALHNLSTIYVAWDTEYLYIGLDLIPQHWYIAIALGIDVNPGTPQGFGAVFAVNHNDWRDCWERKINLTTPFGVGPVYPELVTYLWYQGNDGVTAAQINRYKYENYPPVVGPGYNVEHWQPWEYGYGTPQYVVASTSGQVTKIAIPWEKIMFLPGVTYTGEIAIVAWITHGAPSSALSAAPLNPLVHDSRDWAEWGDHDVLYMTARLTYDQDKDYLPEIVAAAQRRTFYPEIGTIVETDKDTYEVGAGASFTIKARVRNALGHYLPYVKIEVLDHNGNKVGEGIARTQTGDANAFFADITVSAPTDKGTYTWKVKFVGEAGFKPSEKTITVYVPRYGSRIVDVSIDLTLDRDLNGRISAGDEISVKFKLEGFVGGTWKALSGKQVNVKFNYTYNRIVDTLSTTTGTDGYGTVTYTIRNILADVLEITIEFPGDSDYAPSSVSRTIELTLRSIDGSREDWGTELPRSTPGIAPRGAEIVIKDTVGDIHAAATGKYAELDIDEVRITWDGVLLYFFVKFAKPLSDDDHFTVNIAIDVTPENPADGFSEWLYGYHFTDIRLGGFDDLGRHVDVWKWTHVIEAIPIERKIHVRIVGPDVYTMGKLAVNADEGFIEFAVPSRQISYLDPTEPFRVWITVFGVPSAGMYLSLPGANAIDVAGVGDTNLELLTSRDPDWGNLAWPLYDIWVDAAFTLKFTSPATPGIPDPSPNVPPTSIKIVGIIHNWSFIQDYEGNRSFYGVVLVQVKGTQGRPVTVTMGDKSAVGVVGGDDIAIVMIAGPSQYRGEITITATSDGASTSTTMMYIISWLVPPPYPEPWILPIILLVAIIALIVWKRKH